MPPIPNFLQLDIANYAGDNTYYLTNINLSKVLQDKQRQSNTLLKSLTKNLLKEYLEKQNLLKKSTKEIQINIGWIDRILAFDEYLEKEGSFKIHHRNLQKLLIEILKVKLKVLPEIIN